MTRKGRLEYEVYNNLHSDVQIIVLQPQYIQYMNLGFSLRLVHDRTVARGGILLLVHSEPGADWVRL